MKICVFFGHAEMDYTAYKDDLEEIIIDMIEWEGVTQFYSGGRGKFDWICAEIVGNLRTKYPQIKNTLARSYIPKHKQNFILPACYDDTVYLLEKNIPLKFAISKTNKAMIDKADFVVVAIKHSWGGARSAYDYAKRRKKNILNILDLLDQE